jgi:hypothetical protein
MELTNREKEMLMMFGCINRTNTHKRLGLACMTITDPISKAAACSLRNKIYELPCDIWYRHIYCRTKEEMRVLDRGFDDAA